MDQEALKLVEQIKSLPTDQALSLVRRTRALRDYKHFCKTYFPEYHRLPPAKCHDDFARNGEDILYGDGGLRLAIAAPRGVAKTTWHSVFLPLRAIVTAQKKFIVIISDTEDQSLSQLRKIRSELQFNELLREDFGDLVGDEWSAGSFVTKNGVMVLGLGAKQRLRGRGHGAYRPDLIILDDVENDKDVLSPIQRKERIDLINEAVLYAGDVHTDIVMIGTILHQESVLATFLSNPLWTATRYRSVIKWSQRKDLWQTWEDLLTNLRDPYRAQTAHHYYEQHEADMLAGTEVIWPEAEDYYSLMTQLVSGGPAAFAKEKQNDPAASSECPFDVTKFSYYDGEIDEGVDCYCFVDPSMGDKETSDYSAIIILGVGQETKARYVMVADIKRRDPTTIIQDVIRYCRRYPMMAVESEANVFQKYWTTDLAEKMKDAGFGGIAPKGVNHTGNKVARIKSLQPDLHNGYIKFHKPSQALLLQQLEYFPLTTHDDGPDALQACNELTKRTAGLIFASI